MTINIQNLTEEQLVALVKERAVKFIDLQFTDVGGAVKNVTIPTAELESTLNHGIWFDGSAIEGFARTAESDMYLIPDISTFAVLPWLSGNETTARLICNVFTPESQPFLGDPRIILSNVVKEADKMGFIYNTGPEIEFFLLKPSPDGKLIPPRPQDSAGYFDQPVDMVATSLWRQITDALYSFGIETETMHHEVATGQHEIDFRHSNALKTADNIVTFRVLVKILSEHKGLYATFMPKPVRGLDGSGMHIHQSLSFKANGTNAFADPGDSHGLSKIAKHFIAGQLAHARGMCAIIAPLVNSYKRLVIGYEAPVYLSWGRINHSALIRIPRAHSEESTRIELRCPDPSCNPYLAFAVMLAAGLDGIKRELPLAEASEENVYLPSGTQKVSKLNVLPGSLAEALIEMEKDAVVRDALGTHIFERFVSAKRLEWDDYRLEVTPWELDKYLPSY
ncbi:MAG: type I glutamate--ammonia ligase [Ignavibacteriaceae bacterium]|jgi:glutamine synthetase